MIPDHRVHCLASFHYFGGRSLQAEFRDLGTVPEFFLDSGAYSAATQGATLDLEEYVQWVRDHLDIAVAYANLDVIGDPEATWANQVQIEETGLRPIPVIHGGQEFKPWLDRYVERGHQFIALGGIVGAPAREILQWAGSIMRYARDRYSDPVEFHGFGVSGVQAMARLPWRSVDSSTWGEGYRYGRPVIFDSESGRFIRANLRPGQNVTDEKMRRVLQRYGFSRGHIEGRRFTWRELAGLSARGWFRYEQFLAARHGVPEFQWTEGNRPMKVFLADANHSQLIEAYRAIRDHELPDV